MFEKTQKKLREAQFFLRHLAKESQRAVRNEPEAFDHFLSAFVSAARSVTFVLQAEDKEKKYEKFCEYWFAALQEADRKLMDLMREQRNAAQKRGDGVHRIEWELVPVTELSPEELGGTVSWVGPPGIPPPQIWRPVQYYLKQKGREVAALSACQRYFTLLTEFVESFIKAHS